MAALFLSVFGDVMPKLLSLFVSILALCALSACGERKEDQVPVEKQAIVQKTLLAKHARWMPSDAVGVLTVDLRPATQLLWSEEQWGDRADLVENQRKMQREIATLLTTRLGMDLSNAQYVVVGASPTWQSLVVGGVNAPLKGLKTVEIKGVQAFRLQSTHEADNKLIGGQPDQEPWIWGAKISKDTLAFFPSRKSLELALNAPTVSLEADKARLERFEAMLGAAPSRIALGVALDNPAIAGLLNMAELPVELPTGMSMAVGKTTRLTLYGEKAKLEALHAKTKENLDKMKAEVKAAYETREQKTTLEALMLIQAYYGAINYDLLLKPVYTADSMTYEVETAIFQSPSAALGIGAAIAIPAFARFQSRSKASDGEYKLQRLAQQVATSYEESSYNEVDPAITNPCKWPEPTTSTGPVPVGGEKVKPNFDKSWDWAYLDEYMRNEETYFSYQVEKEGDKMKVTAKADFKQGGEQHTITIYVSADESEVCRAIVEPLMITHEFE